MTRVDQILELLRAERRDLEAGMSLRFDASLSLQADKLAAAEELSVAYKEASRNG